MILIVIVIAAVFVALLFTVFDFSSLPSARQHVLDFVREVQTDSIPDLDSYMVVDSVAANLYSGPAFDTMSTAAIMTRCREDFEKQGRYRKMFMTSQVVVNQEAFPNDSTATVEVSYIDRQTRIQYYTQMLLRRFGEGWRICELRLEPQHS